MACPDDTPTATLLTRPRPRLTSATVSVRIPRDPGVSRYTPPAARAAVDATGTRRRLGALIALGYPTALIARQLGTSRSAVHRLLTQPTVRRATAERVAAAYEPLSGLPPEQHPDLATMNRAYIARTAAAARRNGYVPPLCWEERDIDDPAATPDLDAVRPHPDQQVAAIADVLELIRDNAPVERVVAAYRAVSRKERAALVATLSDRDGEFGLTADQIGALLGIQRRQVQRYRQDAANAGIRVNLGHLARPGYSDTD